jgi:hypothetical protein
MSKKKKRQAQATDVSPPTLQHVERLARHEAGHVVVARCLGFTTSGMALTMLDFEGGHSGEAQVNVHGATREVRDICDYLRRRIAVLYAGAIAEAWTERGIEQAAFEACLERGGRGDKAKADELVQLLRNIRYPKETDAQQVGIQLNDLTNECIQLAETILETRQEAIREIADLVKARFQRPGVRIVVSEHDLDSLPAVKAMVEIPAESSDPSPSQR